MTDANIGRQKSGESDVMARARGAATSAADAASNLAGQASGLASKAASALASEAQHKATGLMQQQMESGAEYVRMVSGTAHSAARELEDKAPELARMVHDIADRADRFADDLRGRKVGEMLDMTWDYARRNPRVFLGGAVAIGFLLARFARSSAEGSSGRSTGYESAYGYDEWQGSSMRSGAASSAPSTSTPSAAAKGGATYAG